MAKNNSQQLLINKLPDEILLNIFRKLPTSEFVMSLPLVCKHWAKVVASDVYTLKSVVMHHLNTNGLVFFSIEDDDFINWPAEKFKINLNASIKGPLHPLIEYSNAFFYCLQYIRIYKHIKTLMISQNVSILPTIDNVTNLTTLVFHDVFFYQKNMDLLSELGSVYVNISDVLYINCRIPCPFLDFLHVGFKKLKNIRVDHSNVCDKFLDELLETHHTLESVKFGYCTIMSDKWIDVLLDRLKGQRFIASLDMCSPYFTKTCVNKFLDTDNLFLDKKLIQIKFDSALHPFFISIASIA